jgi:hypothetical protein
MGSKPTVHDMMVAYAEDAVEHARTLSGVTLDYSPDSIQHVEGILEELYAAMPRGFFARLFSKEPSAEDVSTMCKLYGGYIGEVLRRTAGGEWTLDTEIVPGESTICLRKGENRVFPPAKVYKRLKKGSEDNVWFYFQVLMKEIWK